MNNASKLFPILLLSGFLAACQPADKAIEKHLEDANYPLPQVISPVAAPVAEPVVETADEVLKERTISDTTHPGKKGGYKATLFPKSKSASDDGTAFKLTW